MTPGEPQPPVAGDALPGPVPVQSPRYHWYHKMSAVVFIAFCVEIGLFLLIFPWTEYWESNYLSSLAPAALRHHWDNLYLRGANAHQDQAIPIIAKQFSITPDDFKATLPNFRYTPLDEAVHFIGTPDKVIQQIKNLQAKGGIGEVAIVSNFGGIEHWKSIKTQEMFSKHVMPAFRTRESGAAAAD